jgi:hypothetical protein
MKVQDSGRDLVVDSANFAFNSLALVEEPKTFAEACNNPNTKNLDYHLNTSQERKML